MTQMFIPILPWLKPTRLDLVRLSNCLLFKSLDQKEALMLQTRTARGHGTRSPKQRILISQQLRHSLLTNLDFVEPHFANESLNDIELDTAMTPSEGLPIVTCRSQS